MNDDDRLPLYDRNYEDWKPGDWVCWIHDKREIWPIQSVDKDVIRWISEDGSPQWTLCTWVYRVQTT